MRKPVRLEYFAVVEWFEVRDINLASLIKEKGFKVFCGVMKKKTYAIDKIRFENFNRVWLRVVPIAQVNSLFMDQLT